MSRVNIFTWGYISSRCFHSVDYEPRAALEPFLVASRVSFQSCASWGEGDAPWDRNSRGMEGKGTTGPGPFSGPRPGPHSPGTSPSSPLLQEAVSCSTAPTTPGSEQVSTEKTGNPALRFEGLS